MNKQQMVNIANETVNILKVGKYNFSRTKIVDFKEDLDKCVKDTILYKPTEVFTIKDKNEVTSIEVTNETSLNASKRLLDKGFKNVICLNFASAKHPGGGFLKGTIAQEESLAYSSGLYASIGQQSMNEMYIYNKDLNGLYSDYMIYSPYVPVFRDDYYKLMDNYYNISMITSPAVNLNSVGNVLDKKDVANTMINRIDKVLALCNIQDADAIVLGAWGCGVFKNDPAQIASYFRDLLQTKYKKSFKQITFAIKTQDQKLIDTFSRILIK
jgi:uncharacterized protein (TIGR02452 family)